MFSFHFHCYLFFHKVNSKTVNSFVIINYRQNIKMGKRMSLNLSKRLELWSFFLFFSENFFCFIEIDKFEFKVQTQLDTVSVIKLEQSLNCFGWEFLFLFSFYCFLNGISIIQDLMILERINVEKFVINFVNLLLLVTIMRFMVRWLW